MEKDGKDKVVGHDRFRAAERFIKSITFPYIILWNPIPYNSVPRSVMDSLL